MSERVLSEQVMVSILIGDRFKALAEPRVVWSVVGLVDGEDEPYALLVSADGIRFCEVRRSILSDRACYLPADEPTGTLGTPPWRPGQETGAGAPLSQEEVVAFLVDPATHGGETPEHIETHLSHVFLAGGRALKLKKAQNWAVADYSTLALREAYCRRELALNKRFAPDLYVDVRAVTNEAAPPAQP
ncbi:MAG: hypothetical protein AAGF49_14005, partial [Pseudomonadota bacterium]